MAASTQDQLREAIDKQAQLVTAAETELARAERAAMMARTPDAAAAAHRRADAALLKVELVEAEFDRLNQQVSCQTKPASSRISRLEGSPTLDQAPLFTIQ